MFPKQWAWLVSLVEIDEFAVFPLLHLVSFINKIDIIVPYDNTPFWISADANNDDVES